MLLHGGAGGGGEGGDGEEFFGFEEESYTFVKDSPATIGSALELSYAGAAPAATLIFMVSLNGGPTPLAGIDATDPRSLLVGTELFNLWSVNSTGGGSGTFSIPIAANLIALHGAMLHLQTMVVPGLTHPIGGISDKVVVQFGLPATAAAIPDTLLAPRANSTAILDSAANSGMGDVVIAGGGEGSILDIKGTDTTEIYDFPTMSLGSGPPMHSARTLHTAVTLTDGRTLVVGGADHIGAPQSTCEFYDPDRASFVRTGAMSTPRVGHAAALLPDGRVLVVGGTIIPQDPILALEFAQRSAEIWNPSTGAWTPAAAPSRHLFAPGLTALPDGRILLSGGLEVDVISGPGGEIISRNVIGSIAACEIYDSATDTWSSAAAMAAPRGFHSVGTVVLDDGRVLVTGGFFGFDLIEGSALDSSEVYDPSTDTWTALPSMEFPRLWNTATMLDDGRVAISGGSGSILNPSPVASIEIFDPVTSSWQMGTSTIDARGGHVAAVTPDGTLVLIGGRGVDTVETIRF